MACAQPCPLSLGPVPRVPNRAGTESSVRSWRTVCDGCVGWPRQKLSGRRVTPPDDPMTRRSIQSLLNIYVRRLGLDPAVTVHSLRVTALTTARERVSTPHLVGLAITRGMRIQERR